MANANHINVDILDEIIIGRVDPQIYAFTTETIPNYLKVGDTYRPLEKRLNEWRKYFPNLEKKFENVAKVDHETFFRDYAVHYFLESELKRKRLTRDVLLNIPYFSNEFFENATENDLKNAIEDIKLGHQNNDSKYQYYRFDESLLPEKHTFLRNIKLTPRPNQQETINNFRTAIANGRSNLLMYAVMRFGKSFTAMCCALEINAKLVVVVSAKADVRNEWKKTVESLKNFKDYSFLDSEDLLKSDTILAEKQKANEKIVLFLTLQDLQGKKIKVKHAELFENEIDLLLIDESHFGARALEYGKVLEKENFTARQIKSEEKLNDNSIDDLEIINKELKAKIRIHLSGTPYRILMNSEFQEEDIIAFYQFTDIAEDQEKWDKENLNKDGINEWENPYYGFPQMVRFAFHPNESSQKKMEELKKNGVTYAFSELFRPQSIILDNEKSLHKKFKNEAEIIDLLKVIDGSETDKNLLSFLDYDKIKEGKMCRHLVCVLPYRASCDAFEELIKNQKFQHLSDYEIINISGVEVDKKFEKTINVQNYIKKCERENKKTLTLTVNRMLTGSTVPEWDTMLYLKDTASPQEYDQAIFRLQNQYIKVYKDEKGDEVKYNMKPQTLLVDFSPNRMFQMQEQKALIYNENTDVKGNNNLEERLKKELKISPIIVLNNNKIEEVEPADILDEIRKYSSSRSVLDEARTIAIDFSLLNYEAIKAEIEKQAEIGSKKGLEIKPVKGKGGKFDVPVFPDSPDNETDTDTKPPKNAKEKEDEEKSLAKKFATYYSKILFFAFCTESKINNFQELINAIDDNENDQRIARNFDLKKDILLLLHKHFNFRILNILDYKIQNINSLSNDTTILAIERAENAMKRFTRLSESEIVTPEVVTDKMIDALPKDGINKKTIFLDIASKQGEFLYAVYKKFGKEYANNFYSVPTSKGAYEFTRKVYKLLELDMKLLEETYTAYDLIKENNYIENESIKINGKKLKVDVIVGNPPYQVETKDTSDSPIYHYFIDGAYKLAKKVILIHPGRFLFNAGKTPKKWNQKLLNDENVKVIFYEHKSNNVFPDTDIKGGIAITYRDKNIEYGKIGVFTSNIKLKYILEKVENREDFEPISKIIFLQNKFNLDILYQHNPQFKNIIGSEGKERRLTSPIFEQINIFSPKPHKRSDVRIFGLIKNKRTYKWIGKKFLDAHGNLDKFKVVLPKANGSGALGETLSSPVICEPNTGFTFSFISFGAFERKEDADSLLKYIKTKFVRILLGVLKITQDNLPRTWSKIPIQNFKPDSDIDWSKSIEEIDQQLYSKYKLTKEDIEFIETTVKPME